MPVHARAPRAPFVAAALVALAALLPLACVDLFHSTQFEDACDLDAAACAPEASTSPFPADFCTWSPETARTRADRACAWLGACASPAGDNAFGPCVLQATLAYDCAANPNRPLLPGPAHDLWDHLWRAQSCADVLAALLPANTSASCLPSDASYAGCPFGGTTLLACEAEDAGMGFESCVGAGKTCATVNGASACAGSTSACTAEDAGEVSCVPGSTLLRDCDPATSAFDQGIDCASVGAGRCVASPLAACAATGDAGCTPTADVTCSNGVVTGCPSGISEQVDCNALLGAPSCDPAASGRPWDVARACSAGACASGSDTCGPAPSLLNSCARGVALSVDCAAAGLGVCRIDGPTQRAVCVLADGGAQ